MAYFAEIDENNLVVQVIVISNKTLDEPELQFPETEPLGQDFIANTMGLSGEWLQTSYNGNFRGKYAGIGYTFDASLGEYGEFVPPYIPPVTPTIKK